MQLRDLSLPTQSLPTSNNSGLCNLIIFLPVGKSKDNSRKKEKSDFWLSGQIELFDKYNH